MYRKFYTTGMCPQGKQLERRFKSIMNLKKKKRCAVIISAVVLLITAAAGLLVSGAVTGAINGGIENTAFAEKNEKYCHGYVSAATTGNGEPISSYSIWDAYDTVNMTVSSLEAARINGVEYTDLKNGSGGGYLMMYNKRLGLARIFSGGDTADGKLRIYVEGIAELGEVCLGKLTVSMAEPIDSEACKRGGTKQEVDMKVYGIDGGIGDYIEVVSDDGMYYFKMRIIKK